MVSALDDSPSSGSSRNFTCFLSVVCDEDQEKIKVLFSNYKSSMCPL